MTDILGAHHTSFTVANLQKSLEFFRDVLGLELVFSRLTEDEYFGRIVGLPGCRVHAALLRIPGSSHHIELFEYLTPPGQPVHPRPCDPGSCHLSLLVEDMASVHRRLKEAGVNFVGAPVMVDAGPNRGGWGVYLRDPNGILIELFQAPKKM